MAVTLRLGNPAPLAAGGTQALDLDGTPMGNTVAFMTIPDDEFDVDTAKLAMSTDNDPVLNRIRTFLDGRNQKYAIALLTLQDAWNNLGSAPPAWVESSDKTFAEIVAAWFTMPGSVCHVGQPDDWEISEHGRIGLLTMENPTTDPEHGMQMPPIGGGALGTCWQPEEFSWDFQQRWREHDLLTTAGRTALHAQHLGGSGAGAQPAVFQYMAVSTSVAAASAANTTLPSEVVVGTPAGEAAGGGLLRAQAAWAYNSGTGVTTLTKTYTANANDSLPITLGKIGLLNATTAGTLAYETLLNATVTLSVVGDNAAVTHTVTIT